jgi:hypothetical protein
MSLFEIVIRCNRCGHTGSVSAARAESIIGERLPADMRVAELVLTKRLWRKLAVGVKCSECRSKSITTSCRPICTSPLPAVRRQFPPTGPLRKVRREDPPAPTPQFRSSRTQHEKWGPSPSEVAQSRRELREIEERRRQQASREGLPKRRGIPEHEDGHPRSGWFTDADWYKLHPDRKRRGS